MFAATLPDGSPVTVQVSFWQCIKAGIGVSLGIVAVPAIAAVVQMVTKIPTLTTLVLLHIIR